MQAHLGTIVCKFGGDRVTFVVEEAICAKFTDRQTDGWRTPRDCISSFQWNELIKSEKPNFLYHTAQHNVIINTQYLTITHFVVSPCQQSQSICPCLLVVTSCLVSAIKHKHPMTALCLKTYKTQDHGHHMNECSELCGQLVCHPLTKAT